MHKNNFLRIGLLDQYTGENMGDTAIQKAAIDNIKKRHPEAIICLFTLYPMKTQKVIGIKSFPISGFHLSWYSDFSYLIKENTISSNEEKLSTKEMFKILVKRIPFLFNVLKVVNSFISPVRKKFSELCCELLNIGRSYRILKNIDLLIVSGGGQLDDAYGGPWGHPYTLLKWAILAKITNTRFIFLSVGACSINYKLSEFFIKKALKLASYRSYRDEGSKKILEKFDFTRNDPVFPDLAFSYSLNYSNKRETMKSTGNIIGISPIAYLSYSWPKRNLKIFEDYKNELADFVRKLVEKGNSILLFSTDDTDRFVANAILDILEDNIPPELLRNIRKPEISTLNDLMREISIVDYVVASRLHGVLLSHLHQKPVLAISFDRKVDSHMENMGLQEYSVNINRFNSESLSKKYSLMELNREEIHIQIENKNVLFKDALKRQYDHLFRGLSTKISSV